VLLLQHKEEAQLLRAGEVRLQEDETTCSLLAQLHRAGLQLLTSCTVIGTHSLGRLSLSLSRNDARCSDAFPMSLLNPKFPLPRLNPHTKSMEGPQTFPEDPKSTRHPDDRV
jgi:hypothetical protein